MVQSGLKDCVWLIEERVDQLAQILEDHRQSGESAGATFDSQTCLSLIKKLRSSVGDANFEAEKMSEMVHCIADRVIKDTVDRLADKVRSNTDQPHPFPIVLDHFFEGPQGDERRKDLEARVKDDSEWIDLVKVHSGSFKEALEVYESEVEGLAQEYAAEAVKEMVDKVFGQ